MRGQSVADRGFVERLDDPARAALATAGRPHRYPKGATVFRDGDPGDFVALIVGGCAKVVASTAEGTEVLLSIRGPGDLVGELGAIELERVPRSASVLALEALTCRLIPAEEFLRYLEAHPRAAIELLRTVAGRLRDAERRRVEFGAYVTTRRLARLLVELADTHGRATDEGVQIELSLSQQELAGLVGASREAVARSFMALRNHGLVSTGRRSVIVRDMERLRASAP